jgi:hypothetical protein
VGFVVDKVALGQVFLRLPRFSPVNIIPPSFSIFMYHLRKAGIHDWILDPRHFQKKNPSNLVVLGGLVVECLPVDPRFTGSNPGEDDGFQRRYKSVARLPSEAK